MNIGERIKYYRTKEGISQRELGRRSGLSGQYVRNLEVGVRSKPSFETIEKIANGLNIHSSFLLSDANMYIDDLKETLNDETLTPEEKSMYTFAQEVNMVKMLIERIDKIENIKENANDEQTEKLTNILMRIKLGLIQSLNDFDQEINNLNEELNNEEVQDHEEK